MPNNNNHKKKKRRGNLHYKYTWVTIVYPICTRDTDWNTKGQAGLQH